MKVIAGLGNPGRKYENTKHNIGFITIDRLAERHGIKVDRIKHKALIGDGIIRGERVILVKPQTFMNLSGQSIREVMNFYKLPPEDLMVIYDDVDLEMGGLRIRAKGSAGSHNGMKSVVYDLVSDQFPRFRIGIGGERRGELADYVLGGFDKESADKMREAVDKTADAIECALEFGIDKAMNEFNVKPKKAKKKREQEESGEEMIPEGQSSGAVDAAAERVTKNEDE